MLFFIKAKPIQRPALEEILKSAPNEPIDDGGSWLKELVSVLRPNKLETAAEARMRIRLMIQLLRSSPSILKSVRRYVALHLARRNQVGLLTEAGVAVHASFFSEVFNRIGEKVLPSLSKPNELSDFLDDIFDEPTDYAWVKDIPSSLWLELWQLLDANDEITADGFFELALMQSILVLSHRISAMSLEPDMMNRMPPIEQYGSPFISLDTEVGNYIELYQKFITRHYDIDQSRLIYQYERAMNVFIVCIESLNDVRENQAKKGVSLNLVYLLYRIRRAMERMKKLLRVLSPFDQSNRAILGIRLFKELVRALNLSRDLKEHFTENTSLLAYKVAEHTSSTGEHYITTTHKEYWDFLISAMGGGFVISFTNWVKFLIAHLNAAPLVNALLYSANYAGSFITMHVFHFSLATKQPSMTASALARSLDSKDSANLNLETAADLITKISRSQFASFLGNLVVVFPVAFALSWSWYFISGEHIASEEKALAAIASFNPFKTLTILYAALTGIILYAGSFVSGYCDNFVMYGQVHERIRKHRFWRKYLPDRWLNRIGEYVEQNLGALFGNIFLGFALGTTPIIGVITGLPLDVRHVTIAAGGSAIAFASIWAKLPPSEIALTLLGVFFIGLINFLVSFGLSLSLAMSSRRADFNESRALIRLVIQRFLKNPMYFIFPPKNERNR